MNKRDVQKSAEKYCAICFNKTVNPVCERCGTKLVLGEIDYSKTSSATVYSYQQNPVMSSSDQNPARQQISKVVYAQPVVVQSVEKLSLLNTSKYFHWANRFYILFLVFLWIIQTVVFGFNIYALSNIQDNDTMIAIAVVAYVVFVMLIIGMIVWLYLLNKYLSKLLYSVNSPIKTAHLLREEVIVMMLEIEQLKQELSSLKKG